MKPTALQLDALQGDIARAVAARDARAVAAGWRAVLDYFTQISATRLDPEPAVEEPEYQRLWDMAGQALANLGGQAEPPVETVADYDSDRYGPMLGVSDEGSATAAIRHGALASPKCAALKQCTPLTVGVAHDAERLGAVGEVVVGPDEYAAIRLACRGRLLTTTNIGTKVNVRHFLESPEVRVRPGRTDAIVADVVERLKELFAPYVRTPSGKARAHTVLVRFEARVPSRQRPEILKSLQAAVAKGEFCSPKLHRLGVVAEPGRDRVARAKAAVDLAGRAGINCVAQSGTLEDFDPDELAAVLQYAAERKVRVGPRVRVDPQTTARHVWTGLFTARNMGLDLGKYGLVPLTLEDQREVIIRIQYWFPIWAAAPVYYIDHPLVSADEVFHGPKLAAGIRRWLDMVSKHRVRVVLIDTAKKWEGRRLLKDSADDERGFLTEVEIESLTAFATERKVKVLWAGGITMPQAYTFGRLGVFGVYVTSAAAAVAPVGKKYRRDPYLVGSREPEPSAVARVKILLEAGFLVGRGATELKSAVEPLLAALAIGDWAEAARRQHEMHPRMIQEWRRHLTIQT
ncbi:MAG TPA: hypothetical protein VKD90_28100 [Gemmataceae bacterium]|nr:hypothetical protein [Gemmataceae bacterium]